MFFNKFGLFAYATKRECTRFETTAGTIDGVSDTDGIDVTNMNLGTGFIERCFVAHDASNTTQGNENYKLVPWEDIVDEAGSQSTPVTLLNDTSWDHRISPGNALCKLYISADPSSDNTQFYTMPPELDDNDDMGPVHTDYDLEGVDIHPITNILYASSGGGNHQGEIFILDGESGEVSCIGSASTRDIPALAFRETDATLWGVTESGNRTRELVQIDYTDGSATTVCSFGFTSRWEIEGLA